MVDNTLLEIINLCLLIEKKAKDIYNTFASNTETKILESFWSEMYKDEEQHIIYWEKLLEKAHNHELPNIFDNPPKIRNELEKLNSKIEERFKGIENIFETASAFLIAYHLEFYLLHPAFAGLFHLMKKINGETSSGDNYEDHINKLIKALRKLDQVTPEFELFAAFVQQLWHSNRTLAIKIGKIKTIEGFVPICTNCKKIINYKGAWEEVEYYINKIPDETFTHWICPECMQELYQKNFPRINNFKLI